MNTYLICMKVEQDGPAERDIEIERVVQAACKADAVDLARALVRVEQADINAAKIWAWSSELVRSLPSYA